MLTLLLPRPTPSGNEYVGAHWSKKAKLRKEWAWMVRAERLRLGRGGNNRHVPWTVKMTIERWGSKMLDHDNFVAGCKQLLDALVAEGFLADDSPEHLTATYVQHVGKPYRTVVTID